MSLDDGPAVIAAASAGYGLAQMNDYSSDDAVTSGALEPVLDDFAPAANPIWLVYPQTRHLSPKVRAFVDFMIARFR